MTQHALLYARYSSVEQSKGFSLERQITSGRDYVHRMGWTLDAELIDEGRSAFRGANRAEGAALHEFEAQARAGVHRGKILCAENIDRLSRQGAKAAAQLIWSLNENGVDVATWHDGYVYKAGNDNDMMELFSVIVKAQLAYEESLKKSQRTKASWSKIYSGIAAGEKKTYPGRAPAWIEVIDGEYRLIDHRKTVLNEVYDLYIAGVGAYKITQILNERREEPWHTRNNGNDRGWYMPYIHRLLTHRAVLGEYVTLNGETISLSYYPQAISAEKFHRAQAIRSTKAKVGGRDWRKANNLLSGIVKCSECEGTAGYENKGNSVTRYVAKDGSAREYRRKIYERLRCDKNRRRHLCGNATLLDYRVVENAVLDLLLSMTLEHEMISPHLVNLKNQAAENEREIVHINNQLSNLVDALADGASRAIISRIGELEIQLPKLEKNLIELKHAIAQEETKPRAEDEAALVSSLRQELQHRDPDVRYFARTRTNTALKAIIDTIYVHPDQTFSVWTEFAFWSFAADGTYIGGQAI